MNKKTGAVAAIMIILAFVFIQFSTPVLERATMRVGNADSGGCVYLTFDDGPSDRVTPKILDTLLKEDVKATFFIVGRSAERRKGLVRRAFDEGHSIGVHSYSHDYKSIYSSPAALLDDIEKCNDLIEDITGTRSCVYRFPGGSFNLSGRLTSAVERAGYRYVDWNASIKDAEYAHPQPGQLIRAAEEGARGRRTVVLLCHDSTDKTATAQALPEIITYFRSSGYTFCTLT